MSSLPLLDAQLPAQMEDAFSAWQRRSRTNYLPQTAATATLVVQLCGHLIDTLIQLRDCVNDELVEHERRGSASVSEVDTAETSRFAP